MVRTDAVRASRVTPTPSTARSRGRTLQVTDFQPKVNLLKFFFCFYYKHIILIGKTLNTSFTVIKSKHLSNISKKIVDKN